MWQSDDNDDQLIEEIRGALADVGAVPEGAQALAGAVFDLQSIDRELELLTLLYDSSREVFDGTRGEAASVAARYLTFQRDLLTLEVEIGPDAVLGQVVPAQPATISLLTRSGVASMCETDEVGAFFFERPETDGIRLTCTTPTSVLRTTWISMRTDEH
jgi:hypothetical protein